MLSKAHVCSRLAAGIASLYPAEGMDVRLLCSLCVVQVAVSASSWPLVQWSPAGSVCVCVCVWCVCVCVCGAAWTGDLS